MKLYLLIIDFGNYLAAAPLVAPVPDFFESGPFTWASNASSKLPGAC